MKRRILSIAFILCVVLQVLTVSAFAAEGGYSDTAGHWAGGAIERWSGFGVLTGYNGMLRPDDPITRAEMLQ